MNRSWSVVAGAVLFAVGAIGAAVWLWLKRKQLAVAAAKAVPKQASTAATQRASAAADAIPQQTSAATDAIPVKPPSTQ